MRSFAPVLLSLSCLTSAACINAQESQSPPSALEDSVNKEAPPSTPTAMPASSKPIEPFTGKITKNKVRLRLQPTFDGQALRELERGQLVVISGETDDFYAVQPLADIKGYVFRTYVLDNIVEGTRVNVRLKPDLDAPVIAQLNSGDRVDGRIYTDNNKWLEMAVPQAVHFYVAKDYIEKVGDVDYIDRMNKRGEEVVRLLNTTKAVSDAETQKSYDKINPDGIIANYQRIIYDFKDFPEAGNKAQVYLNDLHETLIKRKIAFLEAQTQKSSQVLEQKNKLLLEELDAQKSKLAQIEQQMQKEKNLAHITDIAEARKIPDQIPHNMAVWIPVENTLFVNWSEQTNNPSAGDFYKEQKEKSFVLKGVIEPYNRPVKNKPGNYMLVNSASKLPIAFLYSTHVNLSDYIGHEIAVTVSPRINNNYAFPAYFVLAVE